MQIISLTLMPPEEIKEAHSLQKPTKLPLPAVVAANKIFEQSKYITDEQRNLFASIINDQDVTTQLLYTSSQHGWKYKDFHSRCDKKAPTVSLFKMKSGDVLGGFTCAQWESSGEDSKCE